ncbi:MAG: hypothetical protein WBK88_01265 [Methanothrix sp.]
MRSKNGYDGYITIVITQIPRVSLMVFLRAGASPRVRRARRGKRPKLHHGR